MKKLLFILLHSSLLLILIYYLLYIFFLLNTQGKSNVMEYKEHRKSSGLASNLDPYPPYCEELNLAYWKMRGHVKNQGTLANSQH